MQSPLPALESNSEPAAVPVAGLRRSLLWSLFGTALGIALLYAATRQADPRVLLDELRAVVWPWAAMVLAATLGFCAVKTWRWRLLLGTFPRIGFRDLQAAVYVGTAVNYLVAHVGEVLRAVSVSRSHGLPVGTALASIVIERVLDFIAILAILAIILVAVPDSPAMVIVAAVASAAFVAVAVAVLYLLQRPPAWSERAAARLGGRLRPSLRQRVTHHLGRFRAGLAPLRKRRLMLVALLISALQWGAVVAAIWLSGLSVNLAVSPMAATVTFVLIILGMTLPNSPLQIGTTQLAFVVGYGTDGTGVSEAIAASLVYTAFLIIPTMLLGAAAMLRRPLGIRGQRPAGGQTRMMALQESRGRLHEIGAPAAGAWPTLLLDCPVCRSDAAETLGVAGGAETDAAVVMSCASCATAYLTPPPRSLPKGTLALRRRSPGVQQLRRWVGGLPADARVIRIESPGELPEGGDVDLVVIDRVLECAREPDEFLRAVARLLSADGRILVIADNAGSSCFATFSGRHWIGYSASGARQQLTAAGLERLCTRCGLRAQRVSTHFAATAWLDSARSWLRDWGVGRGLSAVLAGRWLVPALIAGMIESFAVLRGRGAVLFAVLVRA